MYAYYVLSTIKPSLWREKVQIALRPGLWGRYRELSSPALLTISSKSNMYI